MQGVEAFVQGFGPAKDIVAANPDFVKWAHAEGMTVTPYTFRTASPGKFPNVKAEMEQFLYTLGVDGLFTDNPDNSRGSRASRRSSTVKTQSQSRRAVTRTDPRAQICEL